jgi:PPM family protein phosphatase
MTGVERFKSSGCSDNNGNMIADQTLATDLQIIGCTGQHLGDRSEQQDRVAIFTNRSSKRCALALLADGVGGRSGGAIAAENVMMAAQRLFDEFNPAADSTTQFFQALVQETHAILGLSAYTSRTDPHSTLVAAIIQPDRADWCHVGDSRLYFFRGGRLCKRTHDHTLAAKLISEGTMSSAKAWLHPQASHLTQTLGGTLAPIATYDSVDRLNAGDRFVLCSDGLWSYFNDAELAEATKARDLRASAQTLINQARTRSKGHGDNCSMVLMGIESREL